MNRLSIRLWGVLEEESPDSINYQIAQCLLTNLASIKHTSTESLAKLCNVSKPSISRFSKRLGYEDFYDFRAELNQYCPDRGLKYVLPKTDKETESSRQYLDGVRRNLDLLEASELQQKIQELIADIEYYSKVYLMGNMQSGQVASSLHYNLHTLKKNLLAVTGLKEQIEILKNKKSDSLIIIFSVSGEYFRALFSGGEVPQKKENTKMWLVTTNPGIKKAEGFDEVLNCRTGDSLMGANICLQMVAELIALGYWNNHS